MEHMEYELGQSLVEVFEQVLQRETLCISKEVGYSLSMAEIHTIVAVGTDTMMRMSEIAAVLHVTVGTLTVMMNNLVKKNLVERYKSEEDKRIVKVGLTKKGKKVFQAHERFHENLVNSLLGEFDDNDKKIVMQAVDNLKRFICECDI